MVNLQTTYLGLTLQNPVIVSSSGLTDSVEKIKKLEEQGAGAVVLKSLFEEQIFFDSGKLVTLDDYPEAEDYIRNYTKNNSVDEYLSMIEETKKSRSIPIIASINCVSASDWIDFSKKIEAAGADALELNLYIFPSEIKTNAKAIEQLYFDLIEKVKRVIKIPVAVKLGRHFSNLLNFVNMLYHRGVEGVVLFNRFYEPDIDTENLKLISSNVFSSPADIRQSLRWIGIISSRVENIDLAASTGVHDGNAVVKQILAGASAVQVCSILYKKGMEYLNNIISDVDNWMQRHHFNRISDFKGKLNYKSLPDSSAYERSQFMKYFSSYH